MESAAVWYGVVWYPCTVWICAGTWIGHMPTGSVCGLAASDVECLVAGLLPTNKILQCMQYIFWSNGWGVMVLCTSQSCFFTCMPFPVFLVGGRDTRPPARPCFLLDYQGRRGLFDFTRMYFPLLALGAVGGIALCCASMWGARCPQGGGAPIQASAVDSTGASWQQCTETLRA